MDTGLPTCCPCGHERVPVELARLCGRADPYAACGQGTSARDRHVPQRHPVAAVHGESAAARRAKGRMTYAGIPPDTLANRQPRTVMCRMRETPYGLVNAGPRSPARLSYRHAFTNQGFRRGLRRMDRTPWSLRRGSSRSQGTPSRRTVGVIRCRMLVRHAPAFRRHDLCGAGFEQQRMMAAHD